MEKAGKRKWSIGVEALESYKRMQRWYLCQKMAQLIFYTKATNEEIEKHYTQVVKEFNEATK